MQFLVWSQCFQIRKRQYVVGKGYHYMMSFPNESTSRKSIQMMEILLIILDLHHPSKVFKRYFYKGNGYFSKNRISKWAKMLYIFWGFEVCISEKNIVSCQIEKNYFPCCIICVQICLPLVLSDVRVIAFIFNQ